MSGARLVTITGSGGMGKTRLAIALAEQLLAAEWFSDGVCFVSLSPLDAVERIVPALAEALDFPLAATRLPARSPRQQVVDYLRVKRLLLILDNVEHLLGGAEAGDGDAADLVATLLGVAPGLAILATSRDRLQLRAEHVYSPEGLDMSSAGAPDRSSAVALFVQRAQRLRPDFAPARDELDAVKHHAFLALILALPTIALLLAEQGQAERAVELYALAWRHPVLANAQSFVDSFGQRLDAVVAALPDAVATAAQARGLLLDLWETAAALQAELRARGWGQDG